MSSCDVSEGLDFLDLLTVQMGGTQFSCLEMALQWSSVVFHGTVFAHISCRPTVLQCTWAANYVNKLESKC